MDDGEEMSATVTFQATDGVSSTLNTATGETKLSKWNDKAWLKLNSPFTLIGSSKIGDKYKLSYGEYAVQVYDVPEGLEYEIIIGKIPTSNVFTIPVATQNLTFYYQPALTPAEIVEGCVRPENVVGSYAVYHTSKQGGEYGTGKAFHIYRPLVTAADGKTIWGILNFDGANLTVTVDSAWLSKAKYPVIVDPTFGYTTKGGTGAPGYDTTAAKTLFTTTEAGTVTSISVHYLPVGVEAVDLGLYDGTTLLTRASAATIVAPNTLNTIDVPDQAVLALTAYGLAFKAINQGAGSFYYDVGDTNQCQRNSNLNSGDNLPATFTVSNQVARKWSIYATYTATSSGQQLFCLLNCMGY